MATASVMLQITPSERTVLQQLATGAPAAEIARHAGLNEHDVDACLQTLFTRMGVRNSHEAIDAAIRRGIVGP
jgi:DNA-binding CsgD family transcriptional regulator